MRGLRPNSGRAFLMNSMAAVQKNGSPMSGLRLLLLFLLLASIPTNGFSVRGIWTCGSQQQAYLRGVAVRRSPPTRGLLSSLPAIGDAEVFGAPLTTVSVRQKMS